MKFIYLFCLFAFTKLPAQNPFEGKINYTATSPEKPNEGELTIYFSKPGIRLEIKEANRPDKEPETLIINLDSGKIYTLIPNDKQYKTSDLKKQHPIKVSGGKTIAGFSTQAVNFEFSGMSSDFSKLFGRSILYPASELVYNIPEAYKANPEFVMINNGRIVLGGEFFFPEENDADFSNDSTEKNRALFRVMANKVSPQPLDPSLFLIPADYKQWSYNYPVDSTTMDFDSAAVAPVKPPVKNRKKQPAKKSSTTKQNAVRRKNANE